MKNTVWFAVVIALVATFLYGMAQLAGAATGPVMSISANGALLEKDGAKFIPHGISIDTLEYYPGTYLSDNYTSTLSETEAQISSASTYWHANAVRLQFEQDLLVNSDNSTNTAYRDVIEQSVSYAQSLGLVVILSLQTEPGYDAPAASPAELNEPMPTWKTSLAWEALEPGLNSSVLLDVFNEPRNAASWDAYKSAFQAQVNYIRKWGYTNILVIQCLLGAWDQTGMFASTGTFGPNEVFAFHHPPDSSSSWVTDVGNWANQHPVLDDEWTNRSNGTNGNYACWTDAPTSVPAYLAYLKSKNVGILGWTTGQDANGNTFLNVRGSDSFSTANSYGSDYSCSLPTGQEGAGTDLLNYFGG